MDTPGDFPPENFSTPVKADTELPDSLD